MNIDAKPTAPLPSPGVMPASGGEHLGTVLFGLWMTVGLFLDGYFHQNLDTDGESFLTPWHAVFYAGFTASAVWLAAMSRRRADGFVDWRLSSLPAGYDGARVGLLLFAVGGLGDAAWHSAFGVERGIDALLSPTHMLLFAGLVLILTAPLRAARAAPDSAPGGWVTAGTIIAATALMAFFLNFVWGLGIAAAVRVAYDPVTDAGETVVIAGVASTMVTTVVLFTAARVLLASVTPPAGAVTLLFGAVALLVSAAFDEDIEGVVAAVVTGITLDALLRVKAAGKLALPLSACFAATSALLWLAYLGLLSAIDGIAWQAEIWLGTVALNTLTALAVAVVIPPQPDLTPTVEGATP